MGKLLESTADIYDAIRRTKTIAVLGIKTDAQATQPAYNVPQYMQEHGFKIVPVPVYYPEVTEILGERVYRKLADIPGEIDMVNVFRRPFDIPQHTADIIAKHPKIVWLQLGIRNDEVAAELVKAGIDVVQNRCLLVEHGRMQLG